MRRALASLVIAAAIAGTTAGAAGAQTPALLPPIDTHQGQPNTQSTDQGGNTASGGSASATGGDGVTGNTQNDSGQGFSGGDGTDAQGVDTTARSGDARGGAGGEKPCEATTLPKPPCGLGMPSLRSLAC